MAAVAAIQYCRLLGDTAHIHHMTMRTLQPPSQSSTGASSPQLSPKPLSSTPLQHIDQTGFSLPLSRGHSSHLHHRRTHRHHVKVDGRYDDDCGIPQHSEWDSYLTAQQSRDHLLAAIKKQKGAPSFAPPRPIPPHAHILPADLLSTDPATLTPLAASVLQLAKQYSLPSTLDLSLPTPDARPSSGISSGSTGGGSDSEVINAAMGGRRASLSRLARGLQVRESVDWSGKLRDQGESRRVEQTIAQERRTERGEEKEAEEHSDVTFITSINDTDSVYPAARVAAWTECSDVHTAVARLPSCLHSTPPPPASLSFSRLLSLSPATAMLPSVLQPLLVSEPCLELLHHSLFFCLLLLCGSGDDELERFVAWHAAKRRADAAAEARSAAAQSGSRAPHSAAGSRRRRGRSKEKGAVVRYTYYGEDDQHQHRDAHSERMDSATAAAEEDEEETHKHEKWAVDEVPPFSPSRPPLSGPTSAAALSLVPSSHPRADELSALLQRMSATYLRLFLLPRPQHVDVFLSHLPAVVSDTLHASYLSLFPASLPLLHCSLFVERLRETLQALLAGWVATAKQHTLTLPHIRRHGRSGSEEKEEQKENSEGEERTGPIFLQRRRATISTSPLIAHFLSSHSIHTPASLSLSLPLSFPVQLSPAAISALSFHHSPQPAARTTHSAASLHTEYTTMRASVTASERADEAAVYESTEREVEARRAALRDREQYARVLVRDSQQSKYKQLKMNAKQIALRRLSQWNGQGATRESE